MEKRPQQSESRDMDKYIVRFPAGMRARIAEAAKSNNRSMNAEIVARLEESLARDDHKRSLAPDPEELAEIERRAAEWGISKTQALIRMTIEELEAKRRSQ